MVTFGHVGETLRMLNGLNYDWLHPKTAARVQVFIPRCLLWLDILINLDSIKIQITGLLPNKKVFPQFVCQYPNFDGPITRL